MGAHTERHLPDEDSHAVVFTRWGLTQNSTCPMRAHTPRHLPCEGSHAVSSARWGSHAVSSAWWGLTLRDTCPVGLTHRGAYPMRRINICGQCCHRGGARPATSTCSARLESETDAVGIPRASVAVPAPGARPLEHTRQPVQRTPATSPLGGEPVWGTLEWVQNSGENSRNEQGTHVYVGEFFVDRPPGR